MCREGTWFGSHFSEGLGGSWGEVMGDLTHFCTLEPCFAALCCSLCPWDPSECWPKMWLFHPTTHGCSLTSQKCCLQNTSPPYFRREIAFHSQILPYCPRSGIEEHECSQHPMETCPSLEYFILILKESLSFTMQAQNLQRTISAPPFRVFYEKSLGLKPATMWGDLI